MAESETEGDSGVGDLKGASFPQTQEEANSSLPGGRGGEGAEEEGNGMKGGKVAVKTPCLDRRKFVVGDNESREALMDKLLDMEDEINELILVIKRLKFDQESKSCEISSLRTELQEAEDVGRRTELQLLKELDMLHDKNTVLSNLLDIIQERAENAEQELERHLQETSDPSTRSASAVSQVSALSDASCGSDEVFLAPPVGGASDKGQIIHRDWEAKLKNRIESLECLLAEERQKVSTAEKKLLLSGDNTLAPSLSDDVKLRLREKELLQEELLENQRHLRVATDQIQGMRERLHALEDEHQRLKVDYGKLCTELDKRDLDSDQTEEDSDKTPENSVEPEGSPVALQEARLKLEATPSETKDDNSSSTRTDSAGDGRTEGVASSSSVDVTALTKEVALYKLKSEQLEYKVEEISDIWRSKSAATEKEKQALEIQLKDRTQDIGRMNETLEHFREELKKQSAALSRAEEKVQRHEEEVRRRQAAEQELHELLTQVTERENSLRQLRDTVATRDDRLKEKDDIIHYLNSQLEQRQSEIQQLQQRIEDLMSRLGQEPVTSSSKNVIPGKESMGDTDVEKENARLREKAQSLRTQLQEGDATRQELENSKRQLERASLNQARKTEELQAALNIAEEKLRLYETLSTTPIDKALENIKKESLTYFDQKEKLAAEVNVLRQELVTCQRQAQESTCRLRQEVNNKLQQLKEETQAHKRLLPELDRLRTQAERAYRLQQEQRLLRAEHQAIKVRYQTRMDKITQENSKMLTTLETLQREKACDRELVEGVQKALGLMRDAYSQDQARWQEEKAKLARQVAELNDTRALVKEMQQRTADLREELLQQDRSRLDLLNQLSTDRAAWDINRAALQGRINQLEELLQRSSKDEGSSQALESVWAQERAEQQKLLAEAHSLALDLQRQLTSRSQEAEENQRHLAAQMQQERLSWERERREKEQQVVQLESRVQWQGNLQRRLMEIQDYAEREVEQARKERVEMMKRLVETRQQQSRDARVLDDILTGLVRLRELGSTLAAEEEGPQAPQAGMSDLDRDLLKYIKEATVQISKAADMLSNPGGNGSSRIRRSLSSSELEVMREELNDLHQEGADRFPVLDVTVKGSPGAQKMSARPSPSAEKAGGDVTQPSLLRPHCKTPSYTSGSQSAQGSSPASPDVHGLTDLSPSRKFLELSAGTALQQRGTAGLKQGAAISERQSPHASSSSSSTTTSATATSTTTMTTTTTITTTTSSLQAPAAVRPKMLTKSLSVDSEPIFTTKTSAPRSYSATTTPTQPEPPPSLLGTSGEGGGFSLARRCIGGLSPRSARKKFFEEAPPEKAGFLSWPKRGGKKGGGEGGSVATLHVQGLDPGDVRRVAEQEHEWLLSRVVDVPPNPAQAMKTSVSWHEKMHHKVVVAPALSPTPGQHQTFSSEPESGERHQDPLSPPSLPGEGAAQGAQASSKGGGKGSSAKDRRRLFKKSSSLDSDVGACIARAGVTTLASPAAPSAFSPADFLASLKGKLAPAFGRRSKEEPKVPIPVCPPSPLFIPTTVPDIPLRPPASTGSITTAVAAESRGQPTVDTATGEESGDATDSHLEGQGSRGRGFSRRLDSGREVSGDARDIRWRSMSADRATRPLLVHTDVILPAQVWQFSETAV